MNAQKMLENDEFGHLGKISKNLSWNELN